MLAALEKHITAAENKLENLHSREKLLTLPPAWSSSVGFHPPGGGGASSEVPLCGALESFCLCELYIKRSCVL